MLLFLSLKTMDKIAETRHSFSPHSKGIIPRLSNQRLPWVVSAPQYDIDFLVDSVVGYFEKYFKDVVPLTTSFLF